MRKLSLDRVPGALAFLLYLGVAILLQPVSYWLRGSAPEQAGALLAGVLVALLALVALPARAVAAGRARTILLLWPSLGVLPAIAAVAIFYAGDSATMHWINLAGFIPALALGAIVVSVTNRKRAIQ